MDLYDYIAATNPQLTAAVIESFGYRLQNEDLAQCARAFVTNEGEEGLRKLCAIHPDREIILTYFADQTPAPKSLMPTPAAAHPAPRQAGGLSNDMMLVFLMASTLLITAAIITK